MAEGDLLKISAIAQDATMKLRVGAAIAQAAVFNLTGGGAGAATPTIKGNAKTALADPIQEAANRWRWVIGADPTILSHSADLTQVTDVMISNVVSANWPILWA